MEAAISRTPVLAWSRRRLISAAVIGMSCGLTAMMSLLIHHTVRSDMIATGFVCAVVIDHIIRRITRKFRRRVEQLQADLERRVIERTAELTAMRTELHVRDRLATAGTLAAGVCHEIRSPLSVLVMNVEELGEIADVRPDQMQMIADMRDAADRITVIVRDLSSLARPGSEELAPVALVPVIDGAARLASYKFDANVVLAKTLDDVPLVTGNAGRLGQVVLNLLANAARASRPGIANTISITTRTTADTVTLAIADSGVGMSAEIQKRLFEPFFTTGAERGGTGLGLTICRSIVERMGGTITIASELDIGTTVEVTLRRA
ncbi:MAG: HAMP domain-containing sensor histidine kinase [Deltaproteobacteria bacterium]